MKRIIAVLMLIVIMLSGCSQKPISSSDKVNSALKEMQKDTVSSKKESTVSIACSVTDSFSPYNAVTSLNKDLAPLLYDSLVWLDESFTANYSLATDIKYDDKKITVTLKNAEFSDGSSVTANDIVYCVEKAMKSKTKYAEALSDVESVLAQASNKVVFNLKKTDPYFENQLDFPIYKKGSDDRTSSDNIELPPIGGGIYKINKEKTELNFNKNYQGKAPKVKTIKLINTPDYDALNHNLEVGNVTSYYSDLSDCELPQVRGGYESVNINNLVFLGTNMKEGLMSYPDMRQAVSAALDRKSIVEEAYFQNAIVASSVFNPAWAELSNTVPSNENEASENVYLALLEKIGYNRKDSGGYFINSSGERLKLSLVYYEGNKWRASAAKHIKTDLKLAGIEVELKKLSWKDYKTYIKEGYYDIYLAEVKIGNNMDITELVTKNGSAAFGVYYKGNKEAKAEDEEKEKNLQTDSSQEGDLSQETNDLSQKADDKETDKEEETPESKKEKFAGITAAKLKEFYKGKAPLPDVASAFATELPIIPICYRMGILCYTTDIGSMKPTCNNVYRGIENSLTGQ